MGRTTYEEHVAHVGHGARVPVTDGLVEGTGRLQHSDGRMAARSERQRVEGAGDGEKGMGRTTYPEHVAHVGHGARDPVTDVLVEGIGILQHSDGRMAARSERQCVEGAGDGEKGMGRTTYLNMLLMSVTELVSQLPMGWLKSAADYSTAMGGWPRGVSVNASRGRATEKKEWGGPRTLNM
jgi:hypothetical protein